MSSPAPIPTPVTPASASAARGWDRLAITVLGATGCALSYDALRQTAHAAHVHSALTYLFPVLVDGFIAYSVRALLVLRGAPFRARLYAWALFAIATSASIWANALHAIRLNQLPHQQAELHLGDIPVGLLSTLPPLALAGATHLFILITRHDTPPAPRPGPVVHTPVDDRPAGPRRSGPVRPTVADGPTPADGAPPLVLVPNTRSAESAPAPEASAHPAEPEPEEDASPVRRTVGRPPSAPIDTLEEIAWTAVQDAGKLTRAVVEQAVRDAGHTISATRLTDLMDRLRARTSA